MRKAVLVVWLLGSIMALFLSLFVFADLIVEGETHSLGDVTTNFLLASIIGIESVAIIFLAKVKVRKYSSIIALTALIATVVCSIGYVSLYWWPGAFYLARYDGWPTPWAIIIVLFCIPLMLAGASSFLISERRNRLKDRG